MCKTLKLTLSLFGGRANHLKFLTGYPGYGLYGLLNQGSRRLTGDVASVGDFLSNLSFPELPNESNLVLRAISATASSGLERLILGRGFPSVYGGPLVTIDTPRLALRPFS